VQGKGIDARGLVLHNAHTYTESPSCPTMPVWTIVITTSAAVNAMKRCREK
jgi:hypothetical protein